MKHSAYNKNTSWVTPINMQFGQKTLITLTLYKYDNYMHFNNPSYIYTCMWPRESSVRAEQQELMECTSK